MNILRALAKVPELISLILSIGKAIKSGISAIKIGKLVKRMEGEIEKATVTKNTTDLENMFVNPTGRSN